VLSHGKHQILRTRTCRATSAGEGWALYFEACGFETRACVLYFEACGGARVNVAPDADDWNREHRVTGALKYLALTVAREPMVPVALATGLDPALEALRV
jgi:hypothetical protein